MAAVSYRRTDWGDGTGSAQRMDGLRGLGERVEPDPGDPQRVYTPDGLDFSLRAGSAC